MQAHCILLLNVQSPKYIILKNNSDDRQNVQSPEYIILKNNSTTAKIKLIMFSLPASFIFMVLSQWYSEL